MRFQDLMVASMKMTALWDTAPYNFVEVDWRFRGAYCLHHQGDEPHCPDNGGNRHLWNVGLLQQDYMALYPRKLSSSYQIYLQDESEKSDTFYTPLTQRRGVHAWGNRLCVVRPKKTFSIEHWTAARCAFGVEIYLKNHETMVKTCRLFRRQWGIKNTIKSWVQTFRETA
jgi:hypothetical protein